MDSQLVEQQILQATLCEVERGLFHVTYRISGAGLGSRHLPRYQVGASTSDAQARVEQRARECGYHSVAWEVALTEPLVAQTATHEGVPLTP